LPGDEDVQDGLHRRVEHRRERRQGNANIASSFGRAPENWTRNQNVRYGTPCTSRWQHPLDAKSTPTLELKDKTLQDNVKTPLQDKLSLFSARARAHATWPVPHARREYSGWDAMCSQSESPSQSLFFRWPSKPRHPTGMEACLVLLQININRCRDGHGLRVELLVLPAAPSGDHLGQVTRLQHARTHARESITAAPPQSRSHLLLHCRCLHIQSSPSSLAAPRAASSRFEPRCLLEDAPAPPLPRAR